MLNNDSNHMKPIYLLALLRFAVVVLIALVAAGCRSTDNASTRPKLTLTHNIQIPKEWSAGSENPGMPDCGTAERYVSAYDRGWWIAVQRYAEDINFDDPSPLVMNGWAEEAYGGQVGYGSALDRIEELIRVYGKQRVSEYLQQFRQPDEILTNAPNSETNDWNALAAYKTVAVIETIPHDACATNMLQLALWLRIAIGEGYRFPVSLEALAVCTNYPNFSNSLLVCPTTGHVPGAISNAEAWTDYIYVGNGDDGGMCDVALVISPPENHGGEYGYVAWGCGNVGKLPAAAVRSLIKAPWCLPAETRGQQKIRGDGFDEFVKPTIKICIPARFASIYGTNSAAASRP